ncbi:MAG: 3-dehydroquinate dehydratase [Bacteriovoracaceae bacterium]|nr:3-dehydroquinate dehydratase [Bacteriovoracaceae bacterium]
MKEKRFLVINGPNLGLLGKREPEVYGNLTLEQIQDYTNEKLKFLGKISIDWFQSDIEGEIISKIGKSIDEDYNALIINPAGYSHTSVAILDALKMLPFPVIEVHLSNTHRREEYRQQKLTAKASTSIIEGLGKDAYYIAIYSQLLK